MLRYGSALRPVVLTHRPLLAPAVWPVGWQVLERNPAHVAEQRRFQGRRRIKTDALDLEAITELVLAGGGIPVTASEVVMGELGAWAAHRTRRILVRTATENQLLGQLDRTFPGLTLVLPDVFGTKVGRLIAAEFADPKGLAGRAFLHVVGDRWCWLAAAWFPGSAHANLSDLRWGPDPGHLASFGLPVGEGPAAMLETA